MCYLTSLLSLFCASNNFAQNNLNTTLSISSEQSSIDHFSMLSGAENVRITDHYSNDEECNTVTVAQGNTKIPYYEWVKIHKKEGIFYSFDEEKEIISAMYRFKNGQNYTTVLKSLICASDKITEITLTSCENSLSKNKSLLRKLTEDYYSGKLSSGSSKQFR